MLFFFSFHKAIDMSSSLLHIAPGAVVCNESSLVGEVSVGARTVVHPKAKIVAEAGPIIIGENNLIEEQATIVNARRDLGEEEGEAKEGSKEGGSVPVMIVGNNNVFEVGRKKTFILRVIVVL